MVAAYSIYAFKMIYYVLIKSILDEGTRMETVGIKFRQKGLADVVACVIFNGKPSPCVEIK